MPKIGVSVHRACETLGRLTSPGVAGLGQGSCGGVHLWRSLMRQRSLSGWVHTLGLVLALHLGRGTSTMQVRALLCCTQRWKKHRESDHTWIREECWHESNGRWNCSLASSTSRLRSMQATAAGTHHRRCTVTWFRYRFTFRQGKCNYCESDAIGFACDEALASASCGQYVVDWRQLMRMDVSIDMKTSRGSSRKDS
jgi:hypothetical protein